MIDIVFQFRVSGVLGPFQCGGSARCWQEKERQTNQAWSSLGLREEISLRVLWEIKQVKGEIAGEIKQNSFKWFMYIVFVYQVHVSTKHRAEKKAQRGRLMGTSDW